MKMAVEFELKVVGPGDKPVDPDALEAHFDDVMDALFEQGAVDADLSARLAVGEVCLSVTVEAATIDEIVAQAATQVRTAIHTAGGITAGWPSADEWLAQIIGASQRTIAEPALDGDCVPV
jgi:hypothetical protein